MKTLQILFSVIFTLTLTIGCKENPKFSGNPLFKTPLTADPSVMVANDTLYLYTGSDEQPLGKEGFLMSKWYVFSTTDMVNWKEHGSVMNTETFSWAKANAFAGHCVENHGKYWWYVPLTHNTIKKGEGFAIGVAVSDHPYGPFSDAIGAPIITDTTANSIVLNIDPCVYVDNDNQVYLFWGSWNEIRMVKLKGNMTEMAEPVRKLKVKNFFEAPFIHKKGDVYYLSYAAGYPSRTEYSTSKSIEGPWEYGGIINDTIYNSPTNHQAIVNFKGNDYFIYHNAGLTDGGPFRRSVCIDYLKYNADGSIKKVIRTKEGVQEIK